MDYEKFLQKQSNIYGEFENDSVFVKGNGTKPSDIVTNGLNAYIVAFRHPKEVNEKVAKFVERINSEIPSVKYLSKDIHTTISDYQKTPPKEFNLNSNTLENLCDSVSKVRGQNSPLINYDKWLFNENTILITGNPSREFIGLSEKIVNEAKKQDIELRSPWGAHITASRFSEEMTPKELEGFFELMKEAPKLGESKPESIDVGWYELDKNKFSFNTYGKFELK